MNENDYKVTMNQIMMNQLIQNMNSMNFNNPECFNPNLDPNMMNMMIFQMAQHNILINPNLDPNMMNHTNENLMGDYYKIIHKKPLTETNLNRSQKNLSLFFNGITDFKKNIPKYGSKILINYYDLEKIELYLDLDLSVEKLISIIFGSIFLYSEKYITYKRTKNDQTTEWITLNPLVYYIISNIFSRNTFFLEYKNKNLYDL